MTEFTQGLAKLFCKDPDSKYFVFWTIWSVTPLDWCCVKEATDNMQINECG